MQDEGGDSGVGSEVGAGDFGPALIGLGLVEAAFEDMAGGSGGLDPGAEGVAVVGVDVGADLLTGQEGGGDREDVSGGGAGVGDGAGAVTDESELGRAVDQGAEAFGEGVVEADS